MDKVKWRFIIDTDSYAGNFERELCGYCTGRWDWETHGENEAKIFETEVGKEIGHSPTTGTTSVSDEVFYSVIHEMHDDFGNDFGIPTPVSLEFTPSANKYNSVAIFFDERPTQQQIDLIKKRAEKFSKVGNHLGFKVTGYRIKKVSIIEEFEAV